MSVPHGPDHSLIANSPPSRVGPRRRVRLPRPLLLGLLLAALAGVTVTIAAAAHVSASNGYPVKVYFSRHPQSESNPAYVVSVRRVSPTLGVATYAMRQLIAGPNSAERAAGDYTELSGALSGPSTCGGRDFVISLDHRGPRPERGTATLQFCRGTHLPGELAGARISAEITAILRQFPNNQRVVILDSAGNCFNDLSGQNRCLA